MLLIRRSHIHPHPTYFANKPDKEWCQWRRKMFIYLLTCLIYTRLLRSQLLLFASLPIVNYFFFHLSTKPSTGFNLQEHFYGSIISSRQCVNSYLLLFMTLRCFKSNVVLCHNASVSPNCGKSFLWLLSTLKNYDLVFSRCTHIVWKSTQFNNNYIHELPRPWRRISVTGLSVAS